MRNDLLVNKQQIALRSYSLFLFLLCFTVISAFGLQKLLALIPQHPSKFLDLILEIHKITLSPEPIERNIFLILGFTLPLLAIYLARNQGLFNSIKESKLLFFILPLLTTILIVSPFFGSDFFSLIFPKSLFFHSVKKQFKICFLISFVWCLWKIYGNTFETGSTLFRKMVLIALISAMFLLIGAWRIVGINGITDSSMWYSHADSAIYATTQVVAGKTILLDLPSQYGLFPEIIAPLLQIGTASFLNYTLLFAALEILSLTGLFFVLYRLIKSPSLLFVGGISLLVMTFLTFNYFQYNYDRYYQYWPIRFFWPAISVLVFYYFASHKNLWRSFLVSATGALGIFWVLDTGIFISLSFGAYLAARSIIAYSQKENHSKQAMFYFLALGLHILSNLILLGLFLILLRIKAQAPLHISWLFYYQKIFYELGFAMIPLPQKLHPWMSILSIYLLGVLSALISFYKNLKTCRADLLFYLCMIGFGMFFYYQGRSHIYNLITVSWPALLIIIIMADSTLHHIRNKVLKPTELWLPLIALTYLIASCMQFTQNIPRMIHEAKVNFKSRHVSENSQIDNELAFIKQQSHSKHECLILSKRQGIYHAETHLASPIKGPGLIEIITKPDLDKTLKPLLAGEIDCLFLGIGEADFPLNLDSAALRNKYKVVAENEAHTMLYLTPK